MIRVTGDSPRLARALDESRRQRRRCAVRVAWPVGTETQLTVPSAAAHRRPKPAVAALPRVIVADGGDAFAVGAAIAELHEQLAQAGLSNHAVARAVLRFFGQPASTPSAKMALDLATQADAMGYSNPYHNAGHLCEVMVNMANLAALNATRHAGVSLGKKDIALAVA